MTALRQRYIEDLQLRGLSAFSGLIRPPIPEITGH